MRKRRLHLSATDPEGTARETVTVVAYPGFPSNCYSDPFNELDGFLCHRIRHSAYLSKLPSSATVRL